ncbi:hypothetical protein [Pseudomonas sp.]|uniref:hypothetical protein n=1 Tax=Pseudomonas sp. TaxID=306 RepID=UPI003D6F58EE
MSDTGEGSILKHRRSSSFVDEFADKFTAMAMSWNGETRLHVTFGRDSLEIPGERIVPDPDNPEKAILEPQVPLPYRNDIAALSIPIEVAEELAVTLLKMISQENKRKAARSGE